MKEFNNGLNVWDYARNYTSALVSGVVSVPCFFQDNNWVKLGGAYLAGVAVTKFIGGYVDINKLKKSYNETQELRDKNIQLERLNKEMNRTNRALHQENLNLIGELELSVDEGE